MKLHNDPHPTIRKALNRGYRPIRYHRVRPRNAAAGKHWCSEYLNGWIYKTSAKGLHCYFSSLGKIILPKSDEEYITDLEVTTDPWPKRGDVPLPRKR